MDLELLLGVAAVGIFLALCVQTIPAWTVKGRLAAVFIALTSVRNDSLEQYAIAGEFPVPPASDALAPIYSESTPLTSFEVVSIDGGLYVTGTVGRDAQAFAISYIPAVSEGGEAHMRWLCGLHRAPVGWRAASAPATLALPDGASYANCRDDGTEDAS